MLFFLSEDLVKAPGITDDHGFQPHSALQLGEALGEFVWGVRTVKGGGLGEVQRARFERFEEVPRVKVAAGQPAGGERTTGNLVDRTMRLRPAIDAVGKGGGAAGRVAVVEQVLQRGRVEQE